MGDCPCKADEIMAKAKSKPIKTGDAIKILENALEILAGGADETNPKQRDAVIKLEATIKYIKANWPE